MHLGILVRELLSRWPAQTLLRSELAGAIFIIVEASSTSPWWSIRCALAMQNAFTIGATNFTGGVTAAEHLLSLGHRRRRRAPH